jgi:hypothetical protein
MLEASVVHALIRYLGGLRPYIAPKTCLPTEFAHFSHMVAHFLPKQTEIN